MSAARADKIKAVFTDLDNTLWDGILAERQELKLRDRYYIFLRKIYKKGLLIVVVSKNDQQEVLDSFTKLGVDEGIFTTVVANWDPKYLNTERLIQQMELRPETVVFIDDNPLEREEIKKKLPDIHVIGDQEWGAILKNKYVDKKDEQSQGEIEARMNRYKTILKATAGRANFKEDEKFLRSLKRQISIGKIHPDNLDRFTRLLVDTHRINFNPGKFEIYEKALDYLHSKINENYQLYAVSMHEGGLSLGLTGALVVKIDADKAVVTDATFSCGILGRGFEDKALIALTELLKKQGVKDLEIFVKLTQTNKRVRDTLKSIGMEEKRRVAAEKGSDVGITVYGADLTTFRPKKKIAWIELLKTSPTFDYPGILSVGNFFVEKVRPVIDDRFKVLNLGSAQGEVLGLLQKDKREAFYNFFKKKNVEYTKIDIEKYPNEDNIVADAENLDGIVTSESQDLVMAVELLEHTEHFWKIINEMIRTCKPGGYIFITVPSSNYPKHEYPVDLWRIGPITLKSFFPDSHFKIVELAVEGHKEHPRRTMILVQKTKPFDTDYEVPNDGKTDWNTGLTVFE